MQLILRYTEAIQKILGCKTKPEPWLHIGISTTDRYAKMGMFSGYAIWVWDTRKVVEQNIEMNKKFDAKCYAAAKVGNKAIDNRQRLKEDKLVEYGFSLDSIFNCKR